MDPSPILHFADLQLFNILNQSLPTGHSLVNGVCNSVCLFVGLRIGCGFIRKCVHKKFE